MDFICQIMTNKVEGYYIPDFDDLHSRVDNEDLLESINNLEDAIDGWFEGFTFSGLIIIKKSCGHYEPLQVPLPEGKDIYEEAEMLLEDNSPCTRCVCG